MSWKKVPDDLKARFDAALPDDPRVERRSMFGCPCAFANGNMFAGTHQENILVRLGPAKLAEVLAVPGASIFEAMPGRVMKEYASLPESIIAQPRQLAKWIKAGFDHASTLTAKVKKKPAAKLKSQPTTKAARKSPR